MNSRHLVAWLGVLAGCHTSVPQAPVASAITVDGSTTVYPMLAGAAKLFSGAPLDVRQSSSGEGIKRLVAGSIDLATSSRAPKDGEYAAAAEAHRQLFLVNVAFDALVVVLHPSNPVADLDEKKLKAIFFDGSITDWSELTGGAKRGPIHVYAAPAKQSGLTDFLAHHVSGKGDTPLVRGAIGVATDPELLDKVAADPDGISIAALGRAIAGRDRVKMTTVDGVAANERSVLLTDYPMARKVYVITNGPPGGTQRQLVSFLVSKKGQEIARQVGLVPVALEEVQ